MTGAFQEAFSFSAYPLGMERAGRMPYPLLIAAAVCLVLALVSLAAPSGITYDPYTWLIWGRDLTHLNLTTSGTGTSWKPLPTLLDVMLTRLGSKGAADAWLVIARAGALFALFMAFRLAWRFAPRPGRVVVAAGARAIPVLWFGGDWLGSGSLTTGADRALTRVIPGSPGASPHPALAVVREAFMMLPLPAWIAIAAALAIPHARRRVTLALAACAAAWTAIVAVMAERG